MKFVEAFNSMLEYRDELIDNCRLAQKKLCDCSDIETELTELHREIEVVSELSRKSIYENAHSTINQDEWNDRNNGYLERHRKAAERIVVLQDLKRERRNTRRSISSFIQGLENQEDVLEEFDERLWMVMIGKVTVMPDGGIMFSCKNGIACDII